MLLFFKGVFLVPIYLASQHFIITHERNTVSCMFNGTFKKYKVKCVYGFLIYNDLFFSVPQVASMLR